MRTRGILLTHVILNLLHLWVKYLSQRQLFLFFGNFFPNIWFPQGTLQIAHTTHLDICNSAYQEWIYACDDNTSYHKGFCPRHLYVWHPTCEPLSQCIECSTSSKERSNQFESQIGNIAFFISKAIKNGFRSYGWTKLFWGELFFKKVPPIRGGT